MIEQEIQRYWSAVHKARRGPSLIERAMALQIEVPKLYNECTHPRINCHLSNLMSQEGIIHAENQSPNASR